MTDTIKLGLIKGRHELPVTDFLFGESDITFPIDIVKLRSHIDEKLSEFSVKADDKLVVYVTGLTPATTALIRVCLKRHVYLTLMHFDSASGDYYPDIIFGKFDDLSMEAGHPAFG